MLSSISKGKVAIWNDWRGSTQPAQHSGFCIPCMHTAMPHPEHALPTAVHAHACKASVSLNTALAQIGSTVSQNREHLHEVVALHATWGQERRHADSTQILGGQKGRRREGERGKGGKLRRHERKRECGGAQESQRRAHARAPPWGARLSVRAPLALRWQRARGRSSALRRRQGEAPGRGASRRAVAMMMRLALKAMRTRGGRGAGGSSVGHFSLAWGIFPLGGRRRGFHTRPYLRTSDKGLPYEILPAHQPALLA